MSGVLTFFISSAPYIGNRERIVEEEYAPKLESRRSLIKD
ncbi:hypothetical protein A2U01_0118854, partial [Trifolium medium]|nr:hypothetical protein [Trifolium medium]